MPNDVLGQYQNNTAAFSDAIPNIENVLMLGCGGFIGGHLLDRILKATSFRVEGWDVESTKIAELLTNPKFKFVRRNFHLEAEQSSFREAIRKADVVINLAAICNPSQYNTEPLNVIRSNFINAYNIVDYCAEYGKWLIHFSTSEVYGRTISSYLEGETYSSPALFELEEDTTPMIMGPASNQRWCYAAAKQLMERYVFAHNLETDLPFTIVRPLNFFGPKMDFIPGREGEGVPRVLACFVTALLDGQPMQLVDQGKARRTIVSIHDAVTAIMCMLEKPERARNQIFNIGNRANEVTIKELALIMREIYASVSGNSDYLNHPIESVDSEDFYGPGYEDCDRRMPRLDKAERLLGWKPEVPLKAVLTETIEYYYEKFGREPNTSLSYEELAV